MIQNGESKDEGKSKITNALVSVVGKNVDFTEEIMQDIDLMDTPEIANDKFEDLIQ